jgi:hypothetical protein
LHGEVRGFLYRFDGESTGRLQDDYSLAAFSYASLGEEQG